MYLRIEDIKSLLAKDKRKSDRIFIPLKIFYHLPSSRKWEGPIAIDDISGGGLRFKSTKKLLKGKELTFKINLPGNKTPLTFKGAVIWCKLLHPLRLLKDEPKQKKYLVGIKFKKMSHADRQKYVKYICGELLAAHLNDQGELK